MSVIDKPKRRTASHHESVWRRLPDALQQLHDDFKEGLTASQSAKNLTKLFVHKFTREAVMGKRSREGLVYMTAARPKLARSKDKPLAVHNINIASLNKGAIINALAQEHDTPEKGIVEGDCKFPRVKPWALPEYGQCKFINGDPTRDDAFICQNSAERAPDGKYKNYCHGHAVKCYEPENKRIRYARHTSSIMQWGAKR